MPEPHSEERARKAEINEHDRHELLTACTQRERELREQLQAAEERYLSIENKALLHDDAMSRADRCERIVELARRYCSELNTEGSADTDELEAALSEYQEQLQAAQQSFDKILDLSEGRRGRDISEIHRIAGHWSASIPAKRQD